MAKVVNTKHHSKSIFRSTLHVNTWENKNKTWNWIIESQDQNKQSLKPSNLWPISDSKYENWVILNFNSEQEDSVKLGSETKVTRSQGPLPW